MLPFDLPGSEPHVLAFHSTILAVLLSFFLSSVIALTYELTTKSLYRNAHFLQALALISIVAFTVVHAVGDSLARGLGILGAMMFIRFRTPLDDPRNTVFLFASLAAGISCGALKFNMAIIGTLTFCTGAILLRFSPYNTASQLVGHLKYRSLEANLNGSQRKKADTSNIENILRNYCSDFELNQQRYIRTAAEVAIDHNDREPTKEGSRECLQECHYLIRLKPAATSDDLTASLMEVDGIESLSLNFKRQSTRL